jgi:acetyl CoA:N6-hydroxylysine acetyl transferase
MTGVDLQPADADRHADLLHGWMNQPHVVPWWDVDRSPAGVRAYLEAQLALPHLESWVATDGGRPFGYVETYRVADDPLAGHYPALDGDRGWHVLVGPPELIGSGVARRLGRHVIARLFADPAAVRVVCEPDARNVRMIRLCLHLAHLPLAVLALPDKRALLLGCTRAEFAARFPDDGVA